MKEDGKWKIWHIAMYYENTPPSWNADTNSYEMSSGEGRGAAPAAKPGAAPEVRESCRRTGASNTNGTDVQQRKSESLQGMEPHKAFQKIDPRFPEPYFTFSETFSY